MQLGASSCICIGAQREQVGQLAVMLSCAVALQKGHTLTFLTGLCLQHWAALCLCCHYNLTTFNDIQTADMSGTINAEACNFYYLNALTVWQVY